MTNQWTPLGYEGDESGTLDGPHEGVPEWLNHSLWDWIDDFFRETVHDLGYPSIEFDVALARRVERVCRIPIDYAGRDFGRGQAWMHLALSEDGLRLRVVDFLLKSQADEAEKQSLEGVLREAGSVWTVGTRLGSSGLQRRVSEPLANAVELAVSHGHAGQRLAEAWNAAFGLHPNPSAAYSMAIKAIEDAAKPVVSPTDATATLGRINGQLTADPKWSLPFQRDDTKYASGEALAAVLRTVWAGQVDRHGGNAEPDAAEPAAVTAEAAEAAVILAVAAVHLFESGAVRRGE